LSCQWTRKWTKGFFEALSKVCHDFPFLEAYLQQTWSVVFADTACASGFQFKRHCERHFLGDKLSSRGAVACAAGMGFVLVDLTTGDVFVEREEGIALWYFPFPLAVVFEYCFEVHTLAFTFFFVYFWLMGAMMNSLLLDCTIVKL
jgi:hypothetical protein